MMSHSKQVMTTFGCFLAVVGVGGALLVWPVRKEANAVRAHVTELHRQIEDLAGTAERVEQLQAELETAKARVEHDLKRIPHAPMHELMSRLSMHVDGEVVRDWSLTQGLPQAATGDESMTAMVIPWTAEIKSRFEAVFDVLRLAESMQDLIRVSSVRMSSTGAARQGTGASRQATNDLSDTPMITAAIVFEAVYDPKLRKEQP